ncbi:neutral/alkaline non-lysosomal ceramidase N-terminal domain-containing protein [Moritella sp. 28]|uniref:neutral/alkaline non-lysosomal ceramidase N-terminal domain-containing protein n=1 Tax=Moritella sp. 28 TaxID=2746232 RepID=UPI001BA4F425|nr:neutral/alkaline non-lysosomal ceramidase N-terminal domain-containing protein [Moritella sp. 28]QUM85792.1 neutral/alkaline non-lysosomal ceramidase N-terminal domain-containing protein [Moritella sp. 28]
MIFILKRFITPLIILVASLYLPACSMKKQLNLIPPNPVPIVSTGIATAGAISVDITPPPGMAMGGYSVMANKGVGFRTRLKARVIYINDGQGNATALVQTDLTSASLLLHHKVASEVANLGLKISDIVITATHTHSAPANHFENDFYNKHMSSQAGLDEQYLNFLTQQISTGIQQAISQQKTAKIATGQRDIYGYNRNRSLSAYLYNNNISGIDPKDPDAKFNAVNPTLSMIRIDVKDHLGQFKPLAAFSSFSVHATALSPAVEVYNADLFAYAQKDLQWHIQEQYLTPWPIVHALTTGTQGDMAPALPDLGDNLFTHFNVNWPAAKRLGKGIGKESISLFNALSSQLTSTINITTAAREINIQHNNRIGDITLCKAPAVGAPVAGGAYERRTPYLGLNPFFRGGSAVTRSWFFNDGCQGNKAYLGYKYPQQLLAPIKSFPNTVLFQLIRINDAAIIPLPFEVTAEAGRRITRHVVNAFSREEQPIKHIWVTSNANGYFGYSTTQEEYFQQYYEGGHTLYGKYTTAYLSAQLSVLAQDMQNNTINETLPIWRYNVTIKPQLSAQEKSAGQRTVHAQPTLKMISPHHGPSPSDNEQENYIKFEWVDVNPAEISFHLPLVKIEENQQGKWEDVKRGHMPISDEGYDIEVRYLASSRHNMGIYQARWYNPIIGNYRFTIAARQSQPELYSKLFSVTNTIK